jgi:Txe/YoeB family toxin of Txe-Axe toxin-antitoxin module
MIEAMSLVPKPSSSSNQVKENTFAQCSLEIVLAYLQSKLTEKLTAYDLDALKAYEAGILEFKQSRLPLLGKKSTLELAVQFLSEIAGEITSFNNENLQNIEQIKLDLSSLACLTATRFSEVKNISVWLLRSENPRLGILREVLALDDDKGNVRDAEMIDSDPADPAVGSWIRVMESSMGDLFRRYENLRRLVYAIYEDAVSFFSRFQGLVTLLTSDSGNRDGDRLLGSVTINGIDLDGSLDLLMAYIQNAIDVDTISLAPKQAEVLNAGEHLVKKIRRLESGFIASFQSTHRQLEQYHVLLKTIKALCDAPSLISVVNKSKEGFRHRRISQSKQLSIAIQRARSGQLAASRSIYNALVSEAYRFDLRYDEIKDAARECQELIKHVETHVNRCHAEYAKLDTKWRNFWGQDVSDLQKLLGMVNSAIKGSGWHCEGEAWRKIEALIHSLEPVCEFADISFNWLPLSFDPNSFQLPVRKLLPLEVFVNCLCAVAACDGDFCVSEQRAVLAVSKRVASNAAEDQIVALIRDWVQQSRQIGLNAYISQCVADSVTLKNTPFASVSKQAFLFILNSDGEQDKNEVFIAKSMLQRII